MTTQARKDSWLAYYARNRERINARRREKARTEAGDAHRAAALGHYYANRQEMNAKRTERFVRDHQQPKGAWAREVAAVAR